MAPRKAKRSSSSSSSSKIPPEIIEIILSKLSSVKSLLRFKAVSKSWNTIISDPVFVRNHLQSSNPPNGLFLNVFKDKDKVGFSLVQFEGRKFQPKAVLDSIHKRCNIILCECNGVLLLSEYSWHHDSVNEYVLWNPSTRSETCLKFPHGLDDDYVPFIHGICYDHVTDDFKIVGIAKNMCYGVYSCKNNSWTIKKGTGRYNAFSLGSGIFVDGATYWVLINDDTNKNIQIVYFDTGTDELKKLQKPENLADDDNVVEVYLVCLRGSLFLYSSNIEDERKVQFWIKEKGINIEGENPWKEFNVVVEAPVRSLRKTPCSVETKLLGGATSLMTIVVNYSPSEKTMIIEEFDSNDDIDDDELFDIYSSLIAPYRNSLYFPTSVKTGACCVSEESRGEDDPSSS